MNLIISLLINALVVFGAAYILPGIDVNNFVTAIIVAVVLGLLNTFIKPILSLIALPITIITLGLFALIINAIIVMLVSFLVPGFHVQNFLWAIIFSIVVSIISAVLGLIGVKK
ncbi:MAG TPA: phage holin family protein [Patescibacteria group bacterium]|nr:phage holin family protein [Patescibacteria group bacterium]